MATKSNKKPAKAEEIKEPISKGSLKGAVQKVAKGALVAVKGSTTPLLTENAHEISVAKKFRSVIPFGDPDKYFDLKINDGTRKSGVRFSRKALKDKDIVVMVVPRYKISQDSLHKYAAWQEAGKEKDYNPKSSEKISALDAMINTVDSIDKVLEKNKANKDFLKLVELNNKLQEMGGSLEVVPEKEGGVRNKIIVEIDVTDKNLEEIREMVGEALNGLGIKDSKMAKTAAERLYKGGNQGISSDNPSSKDNDVEHDEGYDSEDENLSVSKSDGKTAHDETIKTSKFSKGNKELSNYSTGELDKDKGYSSEEDENVPTVNDETIGVGKVNSSEVNDETIRVSKRLDHQESSKELGSVIEQEESSEYSLSSPIFSDSAGMNVNEIQTTLLNARLTGMSHNISRSSNSSDLSSIISEGNLKGLTQLETGNKVSIDSPPPTPNVSQNQSSSRGRG